LLLNKNKDIYNDFLELALNKLNGSTGADISENSFNRNVFKALLFSEEQKINTMDSLIKKLDLLSMEGQDLDNFYEQLFRIPRLNSSSFGIMYISLLLNYGSVLIPKGTVLKMNNIFVETVTEYSVSQGEIVLEVKRLAVLPDNLVFVGLDNNVFLDIQNVTPDNADLVNEEKMDFIKTNFVVLETGTYQTESDAEYKIRAHNILQNYGYNNILKMQKQVQQG
jgi:hypothetical protein